MSCAARDPTLTLVYLPHLDYDLQRLGPGSPAIAKDLAEVDAVAGELIATGRARRAGAWSILSEYGIAPVSRPVHINRALREAGLLAVREKRAASCSTPARRGRSRSPITRSRTSMSAEPALIPQGPQRLLGTARRRRAGARR